MSLLYGHERFIYPIKVGGGIDFTYGATSDGINIDEQAWYCLSNANNSLSPDYPSLWDEIASMLSVASGNTFRIEWAAPDGYPHQEGIAIINEDQVWSLDFDSVGFDFPPEVLGFPSDISTAVSSELVGGEHVITSTRSHLGSWLPYSLDDSPSENKTGAPRSEGYASTDEEYEQTEHVSMRDIRDFRTFAIEWVPGLRVKGGSARGQDPAYRELAGVPEITDGLADDGDELGFDVFWRHVCRGEDFIVVYVDGRTDIEPDISIVEVCRLADQGQRERPSNIYEMMRTGGELYRIEMEMFVSRGEYDY